MPKLTDPEVEDAVIALLLRLGPYYPLKAESYDVFLRKLTHDERVLLVIERLSSKLREAKRDRRERPVQPVVMTPYPDEGTTITVAPGGGPYPNDVIRPYDRYAHARLDVLQREVAYALAEIKLQAMPEHPGIALNSEHWFTEYLATFKEADERVRA